MSRLLTSSEAAAQLRVSVPTLYRWLDNGWFDGVAVRYGRAWRFKARELEQWIENHRGDKDA